MVFSELHWVPSALAALITIFLAVSDSKHKRLLGFAASALALVGLYGYVVNRGSFASDLHIIHAVLGTLALLATLYLLAKSLLRKKFTRLDGMVAATLAGVSLLTGLLLLTGLFGVQAAAQPQIQVSASSALPEVEATEFLGQTLTPISQQGNNAIKGTQVLDKKSYRLELTGLVEKNLSLSYDDLLKFPAYSQATTLQCVEGWYFTAKWTGFRITDLLDDAGLKPQASYVVFYAADGYSTGLDLAYLRQNNILMAYGLNDLTLPAERGFPFQVVAGGKYGYKWAKWVTKIDVVDKEMRGYWESRGYGNKANVGDPAYG